MIIMHITWDILHLSSLINRDPFNVLISLFFYEKYIGKHFQETG